MIVGCGDLTILLVGLGFHCFLLKCKEKLRHSLGRPSRSDFVQLEFISAGQIDPEGNVELVFTHASDYTIVVDAKIMSDNGQADNKSDETIPAPKTDDSTSKYAWNNTIIIIIGICIILIVFGAVFYVRKKSGSEEE